MFKRTVMVFLITLTAIASITIYASETDLSTDVPQNGLMLWVKADSGVITDANGHVEKWEDMSGNGNHLVQPEDSTMRPIYKDVSELIKNMPSVRFETSEYLAKTDINYGGSSTVIMYYKPELAGINQTIFSSSQYKGTTTRISGQIPFTLTNYNTDEAGVQFIMANDSGYNSYDTKLPRKSDSFINAMLVIDAEKKMVNVYHNVSGDNKTINEPFSSFKLGSNEIPYYESFALGLKYDTKTRTRGMQGEVAEMLIYNRALTSSELNKINTYLKLKYDTPTEITGIKIKNAIPIMYKGDSFTPDIVAMKNLMGYEFESGVTGAVISSDNPDVIKVENGNIKASGFGKAVITVSYQGSFNKQFVINVPRVKVNAPVLGSFASGGTFRCTQSLENLDETTLASAALMIALYKGNTLVDFNYIEGTEIIGKRTFDLSFDLPQDVSDYTAYIMVVDSVVSMYPLSQYIVYP